MVNFITSGDRALDVGCWMFDFGLRLPDCVSRQGLGIADWACLTAIAGRDCGLHLHLVIEDVETGYLKRFPRSKFKINYLISQYKIDE